MDDLRRELRDLETILPLLAQERAHKTRLRIRQIRLKLGLPLSNQGVEGPLVSPASAAGVNGVGGLTFTVGSPPGQGRLVRIPFYLYNFEGERPTFAQSYGGGVEPTWDAQTQPLWLTGAGAEAFDEERPVVIVTLPNGPGSSGTLSGFRFRTPQIEWSRLRVVGLQYVGSSSPRGEWNTISGGGEDWPIHPIEDVPGVPKTNLGMDYAGPPGGGDPISMAGTDPLGGLSLPMSRVGYAAYYRGSPPKVLVRGYRVGGSASILIQEGYMDAEPFSVEQNTIAGLRAYPEVASPSRLYIDVAVSGTPLTGISFSLAAVCDVLDDKDLGIPMSAPYAREDAMMRRDPPEGQGFVR